MLRNAKTDFLRRIGYLSFTKDRIKHDLLQTQVLILQLNFLNLTSCLTSVKNHVFRYCEKVDERSGKNLFWSVKNSVEVLNKLKSRGFHATSLSTYDFTTLPHNLSKENINLIEWTFKRDGSPYLALYERQAFFTSGDTKRYKLWSCQNVCE